MTSNGTFGRFLRSKIFKGALGAGALVFIGIQFVPVEVVGNNPPERFDVDAPPEVMQILRSSCFDCHSNETRWPFYSHVAPLSWAVAPHVVDGRNALNFSEWGEKDEDDRNFDKESAWDSIESGDMPLWTYIFPFHLDAYLTAEKKATLKAWLLAHQDAEDSDKDEGEDEDEKPAEDGSKAADGDAGSEAPEADDTPGSAEATDPQADDEAMPEAPTLEKKLVGGKVGSKPAAPSPKPTSAPKSQPAPKSEPAPKTTAPAPTPKEPAKEPEKKAEEVYTGDKPCRSKNFQFASVKAACQKGGVPRAKAVMKSVVDKAKARGEDVKCTSCHTEQKTYANKPNAVADYRALLNKK